MRILFTSTAGLGHLLPLLPLALAARAAGHDVAVATAPRHAERLTGLGLQHWQIGEATDRERRAVQRPDDPEAGPSAVFGRLNPLAALPAMQSIVATWRPHVLLSEGAEFAGGMVADLNGLPVVRVHPGMSGDGLWEAMVASSLSEIRTGLGLPADPDARRLLDVPQITYFPESFERPEWCNSRIVRVRPNPAESRPAEREQCVYITFGTEIVRMPFFPALARDAVAAVHQVGLRPVLAIGHEDVSEFADLGDTRIERWVNQDELLPRVQAVICHGGAGTTLGALTAGTPIIAVPFFADQPFNAERIAATRTGVNISSGEHLTDRLNSALREILMDPPEGCAFMADEIRSLPGPSSVIDLAESLQSVTTHSR
jgi:UDP:flavonoid glycosyltransferase YjiC (YdhE family)